MSDSNKNINDYVNNLINTNSQTTTDDIVEKEQLAEAQSYGAEQTVVVKNTILFFIRNLILISSIAYIFIYFFKLGQFIQ